MMRLLVLVVPVSAVVVNHQPSLLAMNASMYDSPNCGDNAKGAQWDNYKNTITHCTCARAGEKVSCPVFQSQLQCMLGHMMDKQCYGLASKFDARNKELTEKCKNEQTVFDAIWQNDKALSAEEKNVWNTHVVPQVWSSDEEGVAAVAGAGHPHGSVAYSTMNELYAKPMMCAFLYHIQSGSYYSESIRRCQSGRVDNVR